MFKFHLDAIFLAAEHPLSNSDRLVRYQMLRKGHVQFLQQFPNPTRFERIINVFRPNR